MLCSVILELICLYFIYVELTTFCSVYDFVALTLCSNIFNVYKHL